MHSQKLQLMQSYPDHVWYRVFRQCFHIAAELSRKEQALEDIDPEYLL
jgi:hypothetical protein